MISTQSFLVLLAIGAAMVAFWLVVRFPDWGPSDFRRAMGHVLVALLVGAFAPNLIIRVAEHGFPMMLIAVFGIIFPVLIYTFLAAAWFLKLAHDMFARYR